MNIKTILIILTAIILISIGIILISRSTFDNIDLSIKKDNVDYVNITEQFPEVKTFHNDSDFRMGLDKCIEYKEKQNNKGNCVEYGIAGNAWYYPEVNYNFIGYNEEHKPSNQQKDYQELIKNNDERNQDNPINYKMTYYYH